MEGLVELNIIALAIPVFFAMIFAEVWLTRRMGKPELYRFNDAISDLSCGIGQQVTGVFAKVIELGFYAFVWSHLALFDLSDQPLLHWTIGLLGYDLAYYWWHRFTHEVNVGWAAHVVHHQSQDYNLAVALRQSMTGWITGIWFYLPLALIGVEPLVFGISAAISLLYQFWIHTEVVDKLPAPFEAVMNTPAHHRVHHAINPQYLDKNYAAILIVWDRMFGTFEPEVEPAVYGTVKPLDSFDPLWAQFAYYKLLVDDTLAAKTTAEKIRVWTGPPGYRPEGLPPYPEPRPVSRESQVKYDPAAPTGLMAYVAVHFVPAATALTGMLLVENTATWTELAVVGALILWTTWNWGALHERKLSGLISELVRLVGVTALAAWWLDSVEGIAVVAIGAAVSALWLLSFAGWLSGDDEPAPAAA